MHRIVRYKRTILSWIMYKMLLIAILISFSGLGTYGFQVSLDFKLNRLLLGYKLSKTHCPFRKGPFRRKGFPLTIGCIWNVKIIESPLGMAHLFWIPLRKTFRWWIDWLFVRTNIPISMVMPRLLINCATMVYFCRRACYENRNIVNWNWKIELLNRNWVFIKVYL